jgi:copper chaperone CopZ
VCAHAVRVSLMSVNGVASVEVSLEKGLAAVKLKPGNVVTLKQFQDAITKNGFSMKQSRLIAAGRVIGAGAGAKFQISGSNETLALAPESAGASVPSATATTLIVDGTIPEAVKGRIPASIRYRSLSEEK